MLGVVWMLGCWLVGAALNGWQVWRYGVMPTSGVFGDVIPIGAWLWSIGDLLQLLALLVLCVLVVRDLPYHFRCEGA